MHTKTGIFYSNNSSKVIRPRTKKLKYRPLDEFVSVEKKLLVKITWNEQVEITYHIVLNKKRAGMKRRGKVFQRKKETSLVDKRYNFQIIINKHERNSKK